MRIDIRLPTLFRATTKRSERERKVYCSRLFHVDIPELSRTEMEVGFRLRNNVGEHVLLTRDNLLYRPLMTAGRSSDDVLRQLGTAFSVIPNGLCSVTSGSDMTRPDLSLAISPVQFPIEYHYYRTGLLRRRREPGEWPEAGTVLQARDEDVNLEESVWENTRNGIDFDRLLDKLATTNAEDLDDARRLHEMQISRLVMVDCEPWYETRPPCVKFSPGGGRFHVGFFPDWLDHQVDTQYAGFDTPEDLPLGKSVGMLEDGVRYDAVMPDLLAFDQTEFAARRRPRHCRSGASKGSTMSVCKAVASGRRSILSPKMPWRGTSCSERGRISPGRSNTSWPPGCGWDRRSRTEIGTAWTNRTWRWPPSGWLNASATVRSRSL